MTRVQPPQDPRAAPFQLLQRFMPLEAPQNDERRLLHRIDLKQAVQR